MAIYTLATALSQARTHLNDDIAAQWPDPLLIPKAQIAFQEMQTALWNSNSPSVRAYSNILTIPANTTLLNPTSTPTLPTDYLTAFELMESGVNSQAGPWQPMTEVFSITELQTSGVVPGLSLTYWQNYQSTILLLGSTAIRYLQMIYRRGIAIPVLATDSLGVPYAENFLCYRAAALAFASVGNNEKADLLTQAAIANLGRIISGDRGSQ